MAVLIRALVRPLVHRNVRRPARSPGWRGPLPPRPPEAIENRPPAIANRLFCDDKKEFLQSSKVIQQVSANYKISQDVLVAVHGFFTGEPSPSDVDALLEFVLKLKGVKSHELAFQSQLLRFLIRVLQSKSFLELQDILRELIEWYIVQQPHKPESRSQLAKLREHYTQRLFANLVEYVAVGDLAQLSAFFTQSFFQLNKSELQSLITQRLVNAGDAFGQPKDKKISIKQILPLISKEGAPDTSSILHHHSAAEDLMAALEQACGDGKLPVYFILRKKKGAMSLLEFVISCFQEFHLDPALQRAITILFKFFYLRADPSGFDEGDKLQIIELLSKELVINSQVLHQIISLFSFSASNLQSVSTFFKNSGQLTKPQGSLTFEQIQKHCQQVGEFVELIDASSNCDFLKKITSKIQ